MPESALIIGYGRMGHAHAEAYDECGVDVVATADADTWRGKLELMEPDWVSVCSYDDAHFVQTMAALKTGAAVICEKPLCLDESQLRTLASVTGQLCCNLPLSSISLPPDGYFYEMQYAWGRAAQLGGWRKTCPGYSFVHGAGIHMIHALIRNTGGRRVESVTAYGHTTHGFAAPTLISASLRLDDGCLASLSINAAYDGAHQHSFTVWTKRGQVHHTGWGSDKKAIPREFIKSNGFGGNMREACDATAICFAIERAMASGRSEEVNYP